jgi:23S rRNA (adenine2503-C2)-methyltransferase
MAKLPDIRTLSDSELGSLVSELGEKPFRAKQIKEWIWQKGCISFDEMTNLSAAFRQQMAEHCAFYPVTLAEKQVSSDGTIKCAFKLHDDRVVEGVLIPTEDRMTACISSQVGCSLTCSFCATGKLKRIRNLDGAEIFDQVMIIDRLAREHYDKKLTNIVYMGMGEPLLNYAQVMVSVDRITSQDGLGMSPRRLTISTAGIAKIIRRMADEDVRVNLALSLHAASDEKRDRIMPINAQNNLGVLAEAIKYYVNKTGKDITFEYILLAGFNDSESDAQDLVRYCSTVKAKVNLIEYNPIDEGGFKRADRDSSEQFEKYLVGKGIRASLRRSRGEDIDAACGQLANKNEAAG